jgi:FkbM family methyltransferase
MNTRKLSSDTLRKALAKALLPRNDLAFRIARKIVNLHHGDNDCDLHTNGELRLARAVLPHCNVVFDVGANVGEWTELALTINPRASYHCFEPSNATFRILSARLFPATVRRNHFGLSSTAEERTLFVYAEGMGSNSLYLRTGLDAKQEIEETIALRTFDDYCTEQQIAEVDFVKIDVEGHELSVLRSVRVWRRVHRRAHAAQGCVGACALAQPVVRLLQAACGRTACRLAVRADARNVPVLELGHRTLRLDGEAPGIINTHEIFRHRRGRFHRQQPRRPPARGRP